MIQTNIVKKELKPTIKSNIIWILSLALLIFVSMIKYETLAQDPESFKMVMDTLPSSIRAIFGMGSGDISTLKDYYELIMLYVEIAVAIYAVTKASSIFSNEEINETADFLYTKPFSKKNIFYQKITSVVIQLVILNIAMFIFGYLSCITYNPDIMIFIKAGVRLAAISLLFFSIGIFLGTSKFSKNSNSIGNTIVLLSYLIKVIADFLSIHFIDYLTIFNYFSSVINYSFSTIIIVIVSGFLFIKSIDNFKNKEFLA